jgi:hypothetical protein
MIVVTRNPTSKQLKQFSLFGLIFLFALGVLGMYWNRELLAYLAWFGSLLLGLGLASKNWARITFSAAVFVTYPIGFALSYLVLGIIYYGVMTPTGLISRLVGRDPLALKRDSTRRSFWDKLDNDAKPSDYFNQF